MQIQSVLLQRELKPINQFSPIHYTKNHKYYKDNRNPNQQTYGTLHNTNHQEYSEHTNNYQKWQ